MDDARIRQLTEEVLRQIRPGAEGGGDDLERRVAALESAVAHLQSGAPRAAAVAVAEAPALRLVEVGGGGAKGECLLEPSQPCCGSGRCRVFGH